MESRSNQIFNRLKEMNILQALFRLFNNLSRRKGGRENEEEVR
jgi:hypothetical protein